MRTWLKHISATDIFMWLIGISIAGMVVWGSAATLISGKFDGKTWLDLLVFGIAQGSIYALIALGYTLVYGILRMINFAHSEVFMVGPFTAYFLADAMMRSGFLSNNPVIGLVIIGLFSAFISMAVAVTLERVAYRPLRNAPRLVPLITAIGASFFLQYTFRGFYGSGVKTFPELKIFAGKWNILGLDVIRTQVVVVIAAIVLMAALYAFVMLTKTGKAMRAVSEDKATAALMGIDVDRIIATTFALGGSLAGAAGFLYALSFRQVNFYMGFVPGIKAFTSAVLGGIGNIPGAMVGGLVLGIIESVGPSLFLDGMGIPASYQLKDVIAFTLLVFILIFRPSGILGERLSKAKA